MGPLWRVNRIRFVAIKTLFWLTEVITNITLQNPKGVCITCGRAGEHEWLGRINTSHPENQWAGYCNREGREKVTCQITEVRMSLSLCVQPFWKKKNHLCWFLRNIISMSRSGFSLLFSCIYMRCKSGIFKMTAATQMMKAMYKISLSVTSWSQRIAVVKRKGKEKNKNPLPFIL